MSQKAPGKTFRKGLSLPELLQKFPDDATAEQWFVSVRWPETITCPRCGSDNVQTETKHSTAPYRCRPCRLAGTPGKGKFSVKTETVMQASNIGYQKWALAIYLFNTSLKGVSSMKLHRDLHISQKAAWHMAHRIREAWKLEKVPLTSPVKVDETYRGGLEKNTHASTQKKEGRGSIGKQAVLGMKSRKNNHVKAQVVPTARATTLQRFAKQHTKPGGMVSSDQNPGYKGLTKHGDKHQSVKHSVKEYVSEQTHTNSVESFCAALKQGDDGTYHQMSPKQLQHYANELAGRYNIRDEAAIQQVVQAVDVSGVDVVMAPVFSHREAGVQFYHADCLKLMGSLTERYPNGIFDMIFADPPYFLSNGGISCHAGKRVSVNKGTWDKSNGTEQNHTFNLAWLSLCRRLLKPNGTLWVSGTHHVIYSIGYAIQQCGMKILNEIAWEKPNPPPNLSCRYFTHSVELILWAAKSPKSKHVFNYQEMRKRNSGKQMKTVWSIPAPQQWEKRHGKHPTQKPVALLDRIILASTHPDALIFDPFAGSATTGVSAIRTGRKFFGCDIDSTFIELSRARLDEAFRAQASQLRFG